MTTARPSATAPAEYRFPADKLQPYLEERGLDIQRLNGDVRQDLELAAGCVAGDPAAWDAFFRRHRPFLHLVCLQLTANPAEADDLASRGVELLLGSERIRRYSGKGSLRGWLRAVTVHLFLDERRKNVRQRWQSLEEQPADPSVAPAQEEGCEKHFRRAFLEEVSLHLAAVLSELPRQKAAFLNLYYFQGQTLAEAAALLEMHESTASRWNSRILEDLGRRLTRFLSKEKGLSTAETADFLQRCLAYLAGRLGKLRHLLFEGEKGASASGKQRLKDDER